MRLQKLLISIFLLVAVCVLANNRSVSSKNIDVREETANISKTALLADSTVEIASFVNSTSSPKRRESAFPAAAAEKRYEQFAALIETAPAEVLRYALPDDVLLKIPSEFQSFFEKRIDIEGELEVISECDDESSRLLYFVQTATERLPLYFSSPPERELLTGTKIRFKGVRVGDRVAADNTQSKDFQTTESALPNTFGEQKILVLLVNFRDNTTQPYTTAQAANLVFGSVNNFYQEASYGQTSLSGNAYGWFTLPINSGDCAGTQTASYAKQAAANAGINLSAYNKFVYVYPNMPACNYGGRGTIGGNEVWINGSLYHRTVAHELGHNFGLYHARSMDCGLTEVGNNCTIVEYGNIVDTMGYAGVTGEFHIYQKERLGWLNYTNLPPITTVQTSGNYFISANSVMDGSSKGLKILKSSGSWYYVELRRPIGFDSFISTNSNVMNGVVVTLNNATNGQENYLLDMTPENTYLSDPALTVNRSYTDASAGFTITPLSVSNSGAVVNVTFGATQPICTMVNPAVSVNPSATQWIGAGSSVFYTVTVTNNNSSGCTANNFNLQTVLPAGWSFASTSPSMYIAPGTSATASLQVNSSTSAADGFYVVGIGANNANNAGYSNSTNANLAVYSSLGISASANQTSYTSTQTVNLSAMVTANGSPMSGANVTFKITRPDGSFVQGSAVTAASGSASYVYKFNRKKDTPGTYTVSVNADLNGVSGSGSTSFILTR